MSTTLRGKELYGKSSQMIQATVKELIGICSQIAAELSQQEPLTDSQGWNQKLSPMTLQGTLPLLEDRSMASKISATALPSKNDQEEAPKMAPECLTLLMSSISITLKDTCCTSTTL